MDWGGGGAEQTDWIVFCRVCPPFLFLLGLVLLNLKEAEILHTTAVASQYSYKCHPTI